MTTSQCPHPFELLAPKSMKKDQETREVDSRAQKHFPVVSEFVTREGLASCHLEGRNPENKNQFPTGMLMFSGYSPNIMREDKSTGAKAIVPRQQTNTLAFWSDYNCMCILPTYTSHIDHRCWNKGKEVYFGTLWKSYLCKCMQLSLMYTHTHEPEKQNRYFFKQNEQDKNKIPKFHMEKLVELPRHRKQCNTCEVPVLFQSWIQC